MLQHHISGVSFLNESAFLNQLNEQVIHWLTDYLMPFYRWNIVHEKSNMSEFTVIIKKVGQNVPRLSTTTFTEGLKCASDGYLTIPLGHWEKIC